jgi:hypothetical protein
MQFTTGRAKHLVGYVPQNTICPVRFLSLVMLAPDGGDSQKVVLKQSRVAYVSVGTAASYFAYNIYEVLSLRTFQIYCAKVYQVVCENRRN